MRSTDEEQSGKKKKKNETRSAFVEGGKRVESILTALSTPLDSSLSESSSRAVVGAKLVGHLEERGEGGIEGSERGEEKERGEGTNNVAGESGSSHQSTVDFGPALEGGRESVVEGNGSGSGGCFRICEVAR